jgi:hypothetical protein
MITPFVRNRILHEVRHDLASYAAGGAERTGRAHAFTRKILALDVVDLYAARGRRFHQM